MIDLVEDIVDPVVSMVAACAALGLSRSTLYRASSPANPPSPGQLAERAPNPRRLSDEERSAIVDVMHSPEFVDQPPTEVFPKLLSQGIYLASLKKCQNPLKMCRV